MYKCPETVENKELTNGSGPKGRGFESRHFDRKTSEDQGFRGFLSVSLLFVLDRYNVHYNVQYNEHYNVQIISF